MKQCNVVCIWQGLGNQMFQYAFAKSLEVHTGRRVYIDAENNRKKIIGEALGSNTFRKYRLDNFKISLKQVKLAKRSMWNYTRGDKWYYELIKMLIEQGKYPYMYFSQKDFNDISILAPPIEEIEENTYIKGWFQSYKYFFDIRHILLNEFVPKRDIVLNEYVKKNVQNRESVSVHIRRGDYIRNNMALTREYYIAAMDFVSGKINNPVWIVFSDDIEYVKAHYIFEKSVVFIDESYHLEDYEQLMLMSKCKHNIIANSTFSWWGAWLNQNENKTVIAPTKWYGSQRNIVPESWIKL